MELKEQLELLSTKLEGKTKDEIKTAFEGFVIENEKAINDASEKTKTDLLEEIKTLKDSAEAKAKETQDHLDALDVRMKGIKNVGSKTVDVLNELITKNFESISEVVRKGKVFIESKAVGNMTLGASLTGDQPRSYSSTVATLPNQILNFHEVIGSINIGNGTYTFPRRTTSEGAAATQVEGSDKGQIDYDLAMIDVNTDFIAGFCVYSKKMANNLPFLESFLPNELRRSYFDAENSVFNTALIAVATASVQIITGKNKIEMLMNEVATLAGLNWGTDCIIVTPADYNTILQTEVSTGAGYGLPGVVTLINGMLSINGIPLKQVNWLAANKYYVGKFTEVKKVVTESLSIQFSTEDEDNFRKNNITARVEAQVGLAVHRPDAIIFGDFTAT